MGTSPTAKATALAVLAGVIALAAGPAAAQLQCHVGTITFYPNGGIKSCQVEADHQFYTRRGDRVKCRAGFKVTQHPNGAIASCTIREPHTFGGTACPGLGRVELNIDGSLRRCG